MSKKYAVPFLIPALLAGGWVKAGEGGATNEASDNVWGDLISMSMEDLVNVKVTSASKRLQSLDEAPSPIYVFTAEDIKRTGARNIMELVRFIPGFYIYPRLDQTFVIANRGVRSSSNDKILFLLDGIPMNNISQGGAVNAHIFPGLDKVKRVEIISGPGSTMWGSDASLGIISIITKDGKDVDGSALNVNMATEDNHHEFNFLSGNEFSEGNYMFSFTYAENSGFGQKKNGYNNYVYDFETVPWNDQHANFNHIYPSYELFGKISLYDVTIKASASEKNIYSFWTTSQSTDYRDKQDKQSVISSRDTYLEISHHAVISDDKTLDTKLSAKQIQYVRDEVVATGINHGSNFDNPTVQPIDYTSKYPENGVGLEFIMNWNINPKNDLLAGLRMRVVNAGSAEINYANLNTGKTPGDSVVRDAVYYHRTRDETYGAYIEDIYRASDKLTLVGGIRKDYNRPREKVSIASPRASVIYKLSDSVTAKYMYNTGYVRPLMSKSYAVTFTKQGSVQESEKIGAHDIALMYNDPKTQFSADIYQMTINDRNRYNALAAAFENAGDLTTQGIEILYRTLITNNLMFDINYGYATAETTDVKGNVSTYYEGIPNQVYAMGINYEFSEHTSLYTSINGWRDLKMNGVKATAWIDSPQHPDYSGDFLVDVNLLINDLMNHSLDVSVYVLNALDQDARLQAKDDWYAWWSYARGRSFGTKVTWKF